MRYEALSGTRMTSLDPKRKARRGKPKSDGNVPMWQLAIGGLFISVGGMLAGVKIAELAFSLWMPGSLR